MRWTACWILVLLVVPLIWPFSWQGQAANAADIYWNGSVNAYWSLVNNWDWVGGPPFGFHRVPGDGDKAWLVDPDHDIVLLSGHTAPINGLTIYDNIHLSTSGYLLAVDDDGAAESKLWNQAELYVTPRSDNSLHLALEMDKLSVEANSAVYLLGSRGRVDGLLQVIGNSLLRIQDGGHLSAGTLRLGSHLFNPGGGGTITVTGTGSQLELTTTDLFGHVMGTHGPALLEFVDGGQGLILGQLNIGSPDLYNSDGGTLLVSAGGGITTETIAVGTGADSYGIVTVSGASSMIEQQGDAALIVGAMAGAGPGTVTIVNNGRFDSGTGTITIGETGLLHLHTRSEGSGTLNAGGDIVVDGGELRKSAESALTLPSGGTLTILNGGLANLSGGWSIQDFQTVEVADGELRVLGSAGVAVGGSSMLHIGQSGFVSGAVSNNGGSVTGEGTIDGSLNNNGGTVAPGDSIGPLTVYEGDYVQDAAGILEIELAGTSSSDHDHLLVVSPDPVLVSLDGILDVSLVGGFEPQVGDSFSIIDVGSHVSDDTGVEGTFATELLPGPYDWNVAYGQYEVRLQVLAAYMKADFDHDDDVDGADFLTWQDSFGTSAGARHVDGDADGDGDVDGADFLVWQKEFGRSPVRR